jgi:hypothetical protein
VVRRARNCRAPQRRPAGYRTTEDFIAAELPGETLRSVKRNVLVARCFTAADEARHGIAFLEEVALYARDVAGAAEAPRAIDLDACACRPSAAAGEASRCATPRRPRCAGRGGDCDRAAEARATQAPPNRPCARRSRSTRRCGP